MADDRSHFLSKPKALAMISLAKAYHAGKLPLPPEIVALKREIAIKKRNAELFLSRVGAVDNAMVYEIVDMRLQLDGLYVRWAESESRGVIA